MFGFSIFMNDDLTTEKRAYIQKMAANGFTGIFTSMHIPEDDAASYKQRLEELGKEAQRHHLDLMVDISGDALTRAGFSFENLDPLKEIGVTGLRMDYHLSNEQIANWSHQIKISLNASTITQQDIEELQKYKADFSQLEAWHNYYPRPETGLDKTWFSEKNDWLKLQGMKVQAFVPGDETLRGPIFAGLPTLEEHRGINPLAAALDLMQCSTDLVYIGDGGLTEYVQEQFRAYQEEQLILLTVKPVAKENYTYILGKHVNRQDEARDVIRSAEARFKEIPHIPQNQTIERTKGSVTVDNENYLRYMGEIQIVKNPLPADERVNVAAKIIDSDIALIDHIHAGTNYQLMSKEGK
ncbi:hypothetical protein D920_00482 [Enterococcus faecalis 13-SD-W-01]|nr:hypothetical protein D920_00482 [Enterococcus faecalis 13-SD-W-01]